MSLWDLSINFYPRLPPDFLKNQLRHIWLGALFAAWCECGPSRRWAEQSCSVATKSFHPPTPLKRQFKPLHRSCKICKILATLQHWLNHWKLTKKRCCWWFTQPTQPNQPNPTNPTQPNQPNPSEPPEFLESSLQESGVKIEGSHPRPTDQPSTNGSQRGWV